MHSSRQIVARQGSTVCEPFIVLGRQVRSLLESAQCLNLQASFLAEEVQNRLFRYGVPIMACRDPYVANMTVATFRPSDVVIAISATGRTPAIVECIELARNYGVCTIAVTTPDSALATAAEIALTTRIAEYPDALTPSATRFAYLTIIDLVAAATGYQMGPQARENLRRIKFNLVEKGATGSLEPLGD